MVSFSHAILAALLHDIGKFYQRAGFKLESEDEYWLQECCRRFRTAYGERASHHHAVYSGKFIRHYLRGYDDVEMLAMFHHVPDNVPDEDRRYIAKLITLADWLASGERRERDLDEDFGDSSREPLISVFSKIVINGAGVPEHYIPVDMLDSALDRIFPVSSKVDAVSLDPGSTRSYRSLWESFTNEVQKIDRDDLLNQLLFLLMKYTLTIPAATYREKPDLSLFYHLKSVAAITACLYKLRLSEEEIDGVLNAMRNEKVSEIMKKRRFLFVGGDISGIQDFIYSVTTEKALKSLRGRSFYIQLLSETIGMKILDKFKMPLTNLIFSGGGHFYLLLPLTEGAEKILIEIRREVDNLLMSAHNGKLGVIMGWQPVSWGDFKDFGDVWEELGQVIGKKKRKKFQDLLNVENYSKIFGPAEIGGESRACEVCSEEIKDHEINEGRLCKFCESFTDLSRNLARAELIKIEPVRQRNPENGRPSRWREVLEKLGYSYTFPRDDKKAYIINSTDFAGRFAGFWFVAHNTPMKGNDVMTLEEIADEAKGIKKWGVLRADVDNLGKIFKEGLGQDRTISRMSMLSYMLSLYFSARVDKIAEDYGRKIYVVYSGGDDLFIIGPWSELPLFAERLYRDFRRFTCNNLTLSGGMYIAPSKKFPVYEAADAAGSAVEKAKKDGKDKFTIFDTTIPWKELEDVYSIVEKIRKLLEDYGNRSVPRSLLSALSFIWREKELVEKRQLPMARVWRLFYFFRRLMRGYKEEDPQLIYLNEILKRSVSDYQIMPYLGVITRWAEFLTRKEG